MSTTETPAATPGSSPAPDRLVALILSANSEYSPALTFGSDFPKQRNGIPLHPYWKESLKPACLKDAKGTQWNISAADIEEAISDTKRALALGHEPLIQNDHYNPTKSYGFIKGVRKNAQGGMDLLHVFMGDAERDEALRRKTSIMLLPNFDDEKGNKYKWFPDHSALVFRPQFRGLNDFTPALAASNGQPVDAVQLTLADEAPPQGDTLMDFSTLRAALGEAAKDKPDDQILALSATALTDTRTELATTNSKLADQVEVNGKLLGNLQAVETERDEAKANVLSLSAEPEEANPQILALQAKLAAKDVDMAETLKQITPKQAIYLRDRIKASSALVLSADASGKTPIDDMIAFAALAEGHIPSNKVIGTPVEKQAALALSADGKEEPKPMTKERKGELLAEAGYAAA
jgi:hypothetical protein